MMQQPVVGSAVLLAELFANLADTEACKDAPGHKKEQIGKEIKGRPFLSLNLRLVHENLVGLI